MNGRALNEKAIEVSPSSSRVLDRAAEILTPFPPSKNRPRPGDWTCPSCGFSNFQRRTACFRCSFPAVPAAPQDTMYGYSQFSPANMAAPQPPSMGHGGGHMPSRSMPNSGGMVPFRAGDWKCGSDNCGYHNFAKNVSCLRCGASRAGAAVVADTAFPSPVDSQSAYGGVSLGGPGHGMGGPGPIGGQFGGSGFPGQHFGGQSNNFGLPSGLGGGPSGGFAPLNTSLGQSVGPNTGGPFDHRAEQAFSSGPNGGGLYGSGGLSDDAFNFLSSGIGSLGIDDRRKDLNGGGKSPAS